MRDVRMLLGLGDLVSGHEKLSKTHSGIRKIKIVSVEDIRALKERMDARKKRS